MKLLPLLLLSALLSLAPKALGQGGLNEDLSAFLETLQDHPALAANRALVDSAEAELSEVFDPVSVSFEAGFVFIDAEESGLPPFLDDLFGPPERTSQFSLTARFRPVPFGDLSDLKRQRQIALARARLNYRETLTELESQAVEAAFSLQLAREGVALGREGLALAEDAESSTITRYRRGAATRNEVSRAQRAVRDAELRLADAMADEELARFSLEQLVGDTPAPDIPTLAPVRGTLPSLVRAEFDLMLAEVGVDNSARELYPVAQASYNYNVDDNNSLSVAIESRTLQPSLTYRYQDDGGGGLDFGGGARSTLQIGISAELSPGKFRNLDAARSQREAARRGIEATRNQAEVEARALSNAVERARRGLESARLQLANAQDNLTEAETREALGLATLLERQQAFIALEEARLGEQNARFELLRSVLNTYRGYAVPLSSLNNTTPDPTPNEESP